MLLIFIAVPLHLKRDSAVLPPMWSGGVGWLRGWGRMVDGARLISHLIIELFVSSLPDGVSAAVSRFFWP